MNELGKAFLVASVAAIVSGLMAVLPSIFSILLLERFIPAQSTESIVVFGSCLALLVAIQVFIDDQGRQCIALAWMACGPRPTNPQLARMREGVDRAFASGAVWALLKLLPVPLMLALATYLHWSLLLAIVASTIVLYGASLLGADLAFSAAIAVTAVVVLCLGAALQVSGQMSTGLMIGSSMLAAYVVQPCATALRCRRQLISARAAYSGIVRAPHSITHDQEAIDELRRCTARIMGIVGLVLLLAAFVGVVPAPSVTVLQAVVSPEGRSVGLRAIASSRVLERPISEGSRVLQGDILLRLDASEYEAQAKIIRDQIDLEEAAFAEATGKRALQVRLLEEQLFVADDLARRRVRSEDEARAARLAVAGEARDWAEKAYARKAAILRLRERLADIDRQLSAMTIRAPLPGVLQQIQVGPPGTPVAAGDALLVLVPNGEAMIEAKVSPADRPSILVGQRAEVRVKQSHVRFGDVIPSTVRLVSADVYDDGNFRAFIRPSAPLQPGVEVEVVIRAGNVAAAQWIASVVADSVNRSIR